MFHPDAKTEEIALHAALQADDLIASLAPGEALRLLRQIEDTDIHLSEIPLLIVRSARLATISLLPPSGPS